MKKNTIPPKQDKIEIINLGIINFLAPIIFLYGLFLLIGSSSHDSSAILAGLLICFSSLYLLLSNHIILLRKIGKIRKILFSSLAILAIVYFYYILTIINYN